MHIKLRTPARS